MRAALILLAWSVALNLSSAPDPLREEPEPLEANAALDYWKAIALMRGPRIPPDFDTLRFIETRLPDLPPESLNLRPDAAQWLLDENPMIVALAHAADRTRCAFAVYRGDGPRANITHLTMLDRLVLRARAASKVYQFANNDTGAALILTDLFTLADHLNQDRNLSSSLAAAKLVQELAGDLEHFLVRSPETATCETLTSYFRERSEERLYVLDDDLEKQATLIRRWLLDASGQVYDRLALICGEEENHPALDYLKTLSDERRRETIRNWADEYRAYIETLSAAVRMPYTTGYEEVQRLNRTRASTEEAEGGRPHNPLIRHLIPDMLQAYERMFLAEAHIDCAEILSEAVLYRSLLKRWPLDLDELEEFRGRLLPTNPFTGAPYDYSIHRKQPQLVIRVPKWIARDDGLRYVFSLYRAEIQARKALEVYQKDLKQMRRESLQEPVPRS